MDTKHKPDERPEPPGRTSTPERAGTETTIAPPRWEELTRRWHAVIPAVRRRWPQLTYMETLRISGDRNHLCRLLCEKYDVSLDEADDMVWRWHSGRPALSEHERTELC